MDGIIMNQFQRFVVDRLGREAWPRLTREAKVPLGDELLKVDATYPDEHLLALVSTASHVTGIPVPELLEDFGTFVAPTLLRVYAPLVDPDWRTLDLLENTEAAIHRVVRQRRPDAAPPRLRVQRQSPDEVAIDYRSERKLCFVGAGIARGLARHFGETIHIDQPRCMHRGDAHCLITVKLQR